MFTRFDPFAELDRLTRDVWRPTGMPMDAYREGDHLVAAVDLPGIDPASVEVTVEHDVLTITAERPADRGEGRQWFTSERPHGRFARQLRLGRGFDAEAVEAAYDRGVLTVRVPVAERARVRRIDVLEGARSDSPSIEATSSDAHAAPADDGVPAGASAA